MLRIPFVPLIGGQTDLPLARVVSLPYFDFSSGSPARAHAPPTSPTTLSMVLPATSAPAHRSTPVQCSQPQSAVHDPLLFISTPNPTPVPDTQVIVDEGVLPIPAAVLSKAKMFPENSAVQRSKENIPVSAGTSVEASPVTDCVGISAELGEGTGVDTAAGNNRSGLGR